MDFRIRPVKTASGSRSHPTAGSHGFVSKQTEPHVSLESGVERLHESDTQCLWVELSFRKVPGLPPGAPRRAGGCRAGSGTFCGLPDPAWLSHPEHWGRSQLEWALRPKTFSWWEHTGPRTEGPPPARSPPSLADSGPAHPGCTAGWAPSPKMPLAEAEPSSAVQGDLNFGHRSHSHYYWPLIGRIN